MVKNKNFTKVLVFLVVCFAAYIYLIRSSLVLESQSDFTKAAPSYLRVSDSSEFGNKFRAPSSNDWSLLGSGQHLYEGAEILASKEFRAFFEDGRILICYPTTQLVLHSLQLNQAILELFDGRCLIQPSNQSEVVIEVRYKKESFKLNSNSDYLDLKVDKNTIVEYTYKRNGVVLRK